MSKLVEASTGDCTEDRTTNSDQRPDGVHRDNYLWKAKSCEGFSTVPSLTPIGVRLAGQLGLDIE